MYFIPVCVCLHVATEQIIHTFFEQLNIAACSKNVVGKKVNIFFRDKPERIRRKRLKSEILTKRWSVYGQKIEEFRSEIITIKL
jgi:hypothetical protein